MALFSDELEVLRAAIRALRVPARSFEASAAFFAFVFLAITGLMVEHIYVTSFIIYIECSIIFCLCAFKK